MTDDVGGRGASKFEQHCANFSIVHTTNNADLPFDHSCKNNLFIRVEYVLIQLLRL